MTTNKNTKTFWDWADLIIRKTFEIIKGLARLLSMLVAECFQAFVYITKLLFGHVVDPVAYCVTVIAVFGIVMIGTTLQWYGFGVWAGGLIGLKSFAGYSAGFIGAVFGMAINLFQLGSKLNRFNRGINDFWKSKNVNTEETGALERSLNWLDSKHRSMRNMSQLSYLLELALMSIYVVVSFNIWNLIWGAISLILPEWTLSWAIATMELLGGNSGNPATSSSPPGAAPSGARQATSSTGTTGTTGTKEYRSAAPPTGTTASGTRQATPSTSAK